MEPKILAKRQDDNDAELQHSQTRCVLILIPYTPELDRGRCCGLKTLFVGDLVIIYSSTGGTIRILRSYLFANGCNRTVYLSHTRQMPCLTNDCCCARASDTPLFFQHLRSFQRFPPVLFISFNTNQSLRMSLADWCKYNGNIDHYIVHSCVTLGVLVTVNLISVTSNYINLFCKAW